MPDIRTVPDRDLEAMAAGWKKVGGPMFAERFIVLAKNRFEELDDVTRPLAVTDREIGQLLILIGEVDGLAIEWMNRGEVLVTYLNHDQPAAQLMYLNGRLYFDNRGGDLEWSQLVDMVETLPVAPREMLPLGLVNDDETEFVAILFIDQVSKVGTAGVEIGLRQLVYVKLGEPLPDLLRWHGDNVAYENGIWDAVRQGKLRPCGSRLNAGNVAAQFDGQHTYLQMWGLPGDGPAFFSSYEAWNPTQPEPGLPEDSGLPPQRRDLSGVFAVE